MFDSATQILASIRKSDLSSIEVSAEHLNHIEQINPKINGKTILYRYPNLGRVGQLYATPRHQYPIGIFKIRTSHQHASHGPLP